MSSQKSDSFTLFGLALSQTRQRVDEYRDMARYALLSHADGSEKILAPVWRSIDRDPSISTVPSLGLLRRISTAQIRVGSNVINSRANATPKRRYVYVTSAAVNLMIYTGGRKTNEWIYLGRVRTYGATWSKHSWIFAGITPMASASTSPISVSAR